MHKGCVLAGSLLLLLPALAAAAPSPPPERHIWFVEDDNLRTGPVDTDTLGYMVRDGWFGPQALVWRKGMKGWRPLGEIPELSANLEKPREWLRPIKDRARRQLFMAGIGFSFGFFSPGQVNKYIARQTGSLEVTSGSTNMTLNLVPRLSVTFAPIEYVQLEAVAEIASSPKTLDEVGGNYNKTYYFTRYSAGGTLTGHFPVASHKMTLFAGAGALYHRMSVEGYAATAPGFRGLIGLRLYLLQPVVLELVAMIDYVKATDPVAGAVEVGMIQPSGPLELDYSGGLLGLNIYFELHKK